MQARATKQLKRLYSSRPVLERLADTVRAYSRPKHIILPEGHDPRVIEAASACVNRGLAKITLVGNVNGINELAQERSVNLNGVEIVDPQTSEHFPQVTEKFTDLRKKKGMTLEKAQEVCCDPQIFGNMLVRLGLADGSVSGAVATSGKVAQAAVWCLGLQPGLECASSFFLMAFNDHRKPMIYADCGFVIDPTASQLACITQTSADSCRSFLGEEPRIAMLSFSTYGSAKHHSVDKVQEALSLVKSRDKTLVVDGDLQVDAAIVPGVAAVKAPGSPVAGDANVFIFPDLQSGNIAYKITERLAGAQAIGPIFQGLAYAANDVSRGCSAEDLVSSVVITAIQAEQKASAV